MMGHRTKRFKFFAPTNLDALVPADHFYRRLEAKLDLSFVRDLVRDCYEELGRPSIDPVVFFKLQLIAFFERITSERRLMETAQLNLAHHWYLGYDLDEPLPDHSSLSKIRSRYGVEAFQRFFERIVELCIEAGLVDGEELYFDATQVEADAAMDSLRPRLSLVAAREHVLKVFEENPPVEEAPEPLAPSPDDADDGGAQEEAAQLVAPRASAGSVFRKLLEAYRHARRSPLRQKASYERVSDRRASSTDPDAQPMKTRGGRARLGYHNQYVVDGGKARIILATLVTAATVMENSPMLDLARWVRFRWRLRPKQATGDKTYATLENIKGLEDDGLKAYVPLPDWSRRTGLYGPDKFTYLPERDVYLCPQGQELSRTRAKYTESVHIYQARAGVCHACPVKSACTDSAKGRLIHRPFDQAYIERVRRYHETAACQRAIRKRQSWLEPLFGEAKAVHGLRRFRLRGLEKVNTEALMTAAGQNL
ncbi:MAG: IS1182 family transposase, partial [Armatimonadota bacterium]